MAWPDVYGLDASKFDTDRPAGPFRPTIVLVHDAWHTSAHLEALAEEIRDAEYKVLVPELVSSNPSYQANSFEGDVRAVFECARPEIERGLDVIVVCHGYSALPGSVAAARLHQHSLNRPRAGDVTKLVFFAGIIVKQDECCKDVFDPTWTTEEEGMMCIQSPGPLFYQDCALEASRSAAALIRPQIADSFRTKVVSPGWLYVPSLYVICELDRTLPASSQRECVRTLQASSRDTTAVVMQAGHSPFLSRVRETAALIVRASTRF